MRQLVERLSGFVQRALGSWGDDRDFLEGAIYPSYVSKSGEAVSLLTAIGYAPFRQGVSLLSGDVAKLPFGPYKVSGDGSMELDRTHPAYRLCAWFPNDRMPAFTFWRHMMIHAIIWTHSYAWLRRDGFDRVIEMIPLLSDRTFWVADRQLYLTEVGGELHWLWPHQVFHLRGMCVGDGDDCRLIEDCKNVIGLGLAANNFASRFFSRGGRIGGVLELPAAMTRQSRKNIEEGFRTTYESKDAAFKTVVLRDNAKFHAGQFDPEKGQLTLSRQEQVKETARILNIPAHKLGDDSRTAYNSLEMEERSYINSSLSHWFKAIAAEALLKLLSEQEQELLSHDFAHDVTELIAADSETRSKVGRTEVEMGAISINEYRKRLKLPPREGGDVYLTPMNMQSSGDAEDTEDTGGQEELRSAVRPVWEASISRAKSRAAARLKQEARRKTVDNFLEWFDDRSELCCRELFLQELSNEGVAWAAVISQPVGELVENTADRHVAEIRSRISETLQHVKPDELADAIASLTDDWKDSQDENEDMATAGQSAAA